MTDKFVQSETAQIVQSQTGLQALVAVELKKTKFHPRDLGQLEFYLEGSVNRTVSRLCFLFFASYLCADFISAYK